MGNVLYPLNQLKEIYPDIYSEHFNKYKGRELVTKNVIPKLNCLWNDVLHFIAVDPKKVYEEIRKYRPSVPKTYYYKIPAEVLDQENAVVYLYNNSSIDIDMDNKYFINYQPSDLDKHSILTKKTKEYYKEVYEKGGIPFLWVNVPHILYKGVLDISKIEIIEV